MNAKEKAKEIIDKFNHNIKIDAYIGLGHEIAKECALIAVNEILNTIYNEDFGGHLIDEVGADEYWKNVKNEINNNLQTD